VSAQWHRRHKPISGISLPGSSSHFPVPTTHVPPRSPQKLVRKLSSTHKWLVLVTHRTALVSRSYEETPYQTHFPPPPANMAKYFHCVSADFPHEKGVGKVGSWNSKCDYLRLPICSLLFGPPKLEWELSAPSWMLIDFWLCVLAGGMRWLAQKGSNGRAINRNLCEIVFLERTNEIYRWGMLCICPVCWLNLPMVG